MRHLTNIYDPKLPDARMHAAAPVGVTPERAWEEQARWLQGKIIARPKATAKYSAEQLEAMGMVGVYDPAQADNPPPDPPGPSLPE